jgi:WD40 repeat protein
MEYSPIGDVFACMYRDSVINMFDATTGELVKTLDGEAGRQSTWTFAFSADGTRIAAPCGEDVAIWNVTSGEIERRLRGNTSAIAGVKFSPDDSRVASISADGSVALWSAETGEILWIAHGHEGTPIAIAFHPDGDRLVTTAQEIRVWESATGKSVLTLRPHAGTIGRAEFSPDGSRLLTADWNDWVIVSDAGPSRLDESR